MTSSLVQRPPRATHVDRSNDERTVVLEDGRRLSIPLCWFPRLLGASPSDRNNFELLGSGLGIHWPDLDEDLSIEGLLRGVRAPRGRATGA